MILVACMAGLYKRFRDAGYAQAKYLLPMDGRPILAQVLDALLHDGAVTGVRLVANTRDRDAASAILDAVKHLGLDARHLRWTDDTPGQAATAALGARWLVDEGLGDAPVLIHNVDTVVEGRDLRAVAHDLAARDGFIDVFDADSPAYSYVRVDAAGVVTEIAEKEPISRLATSGLYGFRSAAAYLGAYARTVTAGEHYVSAVYGQMLREGATLVARLPPPGARTVVLGTPREYEACCAGHRVTR